MKLFLSFIIIFTLSFQVVALGSDGLCEQQGHAKTLSVVQLNMVEELGSAFVNLDKYEHDVRKELIRRNNLKRKFSYAQIFLNKIDGMSYVSLSHDCREFLKANVYAKGESLYVPTIYDEATSITETSFSSGEQDTHFFHYTDARIMLDQLQGDAPSRFESIFAFLRVHASDYLSTLLYMAEDPLSTSGYGLHRVEFDVFPETKVIVSQWGIPLSMAYPEALKYLSQKFKGIETSCHHHEELLKYLVFEDSGIGIVNYKASHSPRFNQWFQVISPAIFKDAELKYGN